MRSWPCGRTAGIQNLEHHRSLPEDGIRTVRQWVEAGASEGNPVDLTRAVTGSSLRHHDGVIRRLRERARPVVRLLSADAGDRLSAMSQGS